MRGPIGMLLHWREGKDLAAYAAELNDEKELKKSMFSAKVGGLVLLYVAGSATWSAFHDYDNHEVTNAPAIVAEVEEKALELASVPAQIIVTGLGAIGIAELAHLYQRANQRLQELHRES